MEKIVKNDTSSNIFIKNKEQNLKPSHYLHCILPHQDTSYGHKLIQKLTSLQLLHPLHVLCKAASWFEESDNSVDGAHYIITTTTPGPAKSQPLRVHTNTIPVSSFVLTCWYLAFLGILLSMYWQKRTRLGLTGC